MNNFIFVGVLLLFTTDHTQARDIIQVKFGVLSFEHGYIPSEYLNQSLYACANASLAPGEKVNFWIDYSGKSVRHQSYEKWLNLNTKISLESDSHLGCFTIPKQQRFTMYFNATKNQKLSSNKNKFVKVIPGIYIGNISNFNDIDKQIWPDPKRMPGYFQSDFQCTDVYYADRHNKVVIHYDIEDKPGYIHKLTVQRDNKKYPVSNWEMNNENYIINEELSTNGPSSVEFDVDKELYFRIFYYTFVEDNITTPLSLNYSITVTIYTANRGIPVLPFQQRYPTSIICPK